MDGNHGIIFHMSGAKLIKMIENSSIKNTVFISGDRHRGGFYKSYKEGYNASMRLPQVV